MMYQLLLILIHPKCITDTHTDTDTSVKKYHDT